MIYFCIHSEMTVILPSGSVQQRCMQIELHGMQANFGIIAGNPLHQAPQPLFHDKAEAEATQPAKATWDLQSLQSTEDARECRPVGTAVPTAGHGYRKVLRDVKRPHRVCVHGICVQAALLAQVPQPHGVIAAAGQAQGPLWVHPHSPAGEALQGRPR